MDTDELLRQLQEQAILIRRQEGKPVVYPDDAEKMANLFFELDNLLHNGAPLPLLWAMHRQ